MKISINRYYYDHSCHAPVSESIHKPVLMDSSQTRVFLTKVKAYPNRADAIQSNLFIRSPFFKKVTGNCHFKAPHTYLLKPSK